jgi:hypothetical protein
LVFMFALTSFAKPKVTSIPEIKFKKDIYFRMAFNKKENRKFPLVLVDGKSFKGIKCYAKEAAKPFAILTVKKNSQVLLFCTDAEYGGIVAKESIASRDIPFAQFEIDRASRMVTTARATKNRAKSVIFSAATIVQAIEEEEELGPRTGPRFSCEGEVKDYSWNDKLRMLESRPSKLKLAAFFSGFTGMSTACRKKWKKM